MKRFNLFFMAAFFSCTVLQNNQEVYKRSRELNETAYVYALPFAKGTSHRVWQGYYSLFSHYGDFAIDFRMKPGTGVYAARNGVVIYVKQSSTKGGVGFKYVNTENGITIRHSDGSYAHYLHLQYKGALVNVGDTVRQGELIGLSGSTGFSAFPHLHFEVTGSPQKAKKEIPVRFQTEKGALFLQPLHRYKSI